MKSCPSGLTVAKGARAKTRTSTAGNPPSEPAGLQLCDGPRRGRDRRDRARGGAAHDLAHSPGGPRGGAAVPRPSLPQCHPEFLPGERHLSAVARGPAERSALGEQEVHSRALRRSDAKRRVDARSGDRRRDRRCGEHQPRRTAQTGEFSDGVRKVRRREILRGLDIRVRSSAASATGTAPGNENARRESARAQDFLSRSMARIARMALATALVATNSIAFAADGLTTLSVGAESSSGKYGQDQSTRIFFVPITGKYETGGWTLKLLVPYIRITGPGNVIGAADNRITLPGAGATRRTETGLGDVVASAFYNALGARGYRWYGDPAGIDLRNVPYAALGASYRVSQPTSAGFVYDWRNRIVQGGARVSELTAYVSRKFSDDWKLQPYAVRGFADGS